MPFFDYNPVMDKTLFNLPEKAGKTHAFGSLHDAGMAWGISQIAQQWHQQNQKPVIIVTEDSRLAEQLKAETQFFLPNTDSHSFPDWETLPYDQFSPHQDIISERLSNLFKMPGLQASLLFLPVASLLQKLPPRSFMDGACFIYRKGDHFDLEGTRRRLQEAGYICVKQVFGQGEFSVRGSLVDIFPTDATLPIRIDLFDNEIESIRYFDPETQKSIRVIEQIELLPAKEYPLTHSGLEQFKKNYLAEFNPAQDSIPLLKQINQGVAPAGIEYYLPLFYSEMASVFDYLPKNSLIIRIGDTEQSMDNVQTYIEERFQLLNNNPNRPLLPPKRLYLQKNEAFYSLKQYPQIKLTKETLTEQAGHFNVSTQTVPQMALEHRKKDPAEALKHFIAQYSGNILIAARSSGRKEHIDRLLNRHGIKAKNTENWQSFLATSTQINITSAPLDKGFINTAADFAILTEESLLGEQIPLQRRVEKESPIDPETVLSNLSELIMDAPVVHETHGVGRYKGLQRIAVQKTSPEFLVIEYAKGDKLYVPVSDLHLIHRYSGADEDHAPLHKLGGDEWKRIKKRATERIRDVASELLDIYAQRNLKRGFAFPAPDNNYQAFCDSFPFEETPDQLKSAQEIIEDMTTDKSMDRLVCGDVGFGKTEVAMRAAFLAVNGEKQVAVLVPTTLLAQQHYQNFCDRFSDWPIHIALMSRFDSKKENDAKVKGLNDGSIDIVIGTHKLLQKSVKFNDLGLFILDEEHRFGVRQKEHLKTLRHEVDMLSLTATPIPRTLNMSLSGIRDLSLIATPPARRHAIKTTVCEWNDDTLRDACLRELHRGGQVYFLHNEVKTIGSMVDELQTLLPEAEIRFAHGQMRERQLENIMQDFYHQRFNLLVCTTIIESGIDNPNANTVVINRADKLGLSQIYQIRGRVGRSHHQAYAYLVRPPLTQITRDAEKRLNAIGDIQDLGAGFVLATHDLEIRGAGELLGEEQSGQIHAIGFTLYSQLLDRAVASMRSGDLKNTELTADVGTELSLSIPAILPEDYIDDPHSRLVLYKRISNATTTRQLDEIQIELIDRFGLLPDTAKNLFKAHEIRIKALPLGINSISVGYDKVSLQFIEQPNISPDKLIQLLQSNPEKYRFNGSNKLTANVDEDNESPLQEVDQMITRLDK